MSELDYSEILTVDGEKYDPLKSSVFRFYLITENGEDVIDANLSKPKDDLKGVSDGKK
jgi:hypothetical protein